MFYCDECAKKNGWPESIRQSFGICEACGEGPSRCNDTPSSRLPREPNPSTCVICEQVTPDTPDYSDWACGNCGQKYEYNEGHAIVLTPEQLVVLQQHFKQGK